MAKYNRGKKKEHHKARKIFKKKQISPPHISDKESYDYICYFDGSFSFGKMGSGCKIIDNDTEQVVFEQSKEYRIHKGSANTAEYLGFINLLRVIKDSVHGKKILILGDSLLVVNQMNAIFAIKKGIYKPYAEQALELLQSIDNEVVIKWISRKFNKDADSLSKIH